jgi:hypothetical protein
MAFSPWNPVPPFVAVSLASPYVARDVLEVEERLRLAAWDWWSRRFRVRWEGADSYMSLLAMKELGACSQCRSEHHRIARESEVLWKIKSPGACPPLERYMLKHIGKLVHVAGVWHVDPADLARKVREVRTIAKASSGSVITGWRIWYLHRLQLENPRAPLLLYSGYRSIEWPPMRPMRAECLWGGLDRPAKLDTHRVPHHMCSCGIYAMRKPNALACDLFDEREVIGQVNLWGTVIEHEEGWRGEYAYPSTIYVPHLVEERYPGAATRLRNTYGVDVYVGEPRWE